MQKCARIWLQMKLTITEYSLTTSIKTNYKIQKERNLYLVLRLRGETEHDTQWQRDHQDPEHLQHSAHEHWHVIAQFSCLLVRFLSSWFTHCIAWLKVLRMSSHPRLESSIPFYFLFSSFIFNLLHFLPHFFHNFEDRSNPAYFAWKVMDSLDDFPPPLRLWAQRLRPQGELRRVLHRVPDQPTVSPSKSSSRTWSTMTPHLRMCIAKHTEYMSITPSEKACLSVSRGRPCPSERGRSVGERTGATCWTNWSGAKHWTRTD